MAAYIQMLDRETGEPVPFVDIDEKMCKDFDVEVDAKRYYREWYDMICFPLALGDTYEVIRQRWIGYGDVAIGDFEILTWLEERYEPKNWFGRNYDK